MKSTNKMRLKDGKSDEGLTTLLVWRHYSKGNRTSDSTVLMYASVSQNNTLQCGNATNSKPIKKKKKLNRHHTQAGEKGVFTFTAQWLKARGTALPTCISHLPQTRHQLVISLLCLLGLLIEYCLHPHTTSRETHFLLLLYFSMDIV